MALINVALSFGDEYFCFVIYFSKIFLKFFFPNFFSIFKFFFEGFTLDDPPFTETKRTLCICVLKNIIYSKRSKSNFRLV